jgi:hypothetical protein
MVISSFEDLIDEDLCKEIFNKIRKFKEYLVKQYEPDIIIGLQRKGECILSEIEQTDNIDIPDYISTNEDNFEDKEIENHVVIIFDDSASSGNKLIRNVEIIMRNNPLKVIIAPLLINENAINNINKKYKKEIQEGKIVIDYQEKFPNYEEQQDYYETCMIPLMAYLKRNLNNQFISYEFYLDGKLDNEDILSVLGDLTIGDSTTTELDLELVSRENRRLLHTRISRLQFEDEDGYLNEIVEDEEYCKIRWYIDNEFRATRIECVPMYVPIFRFKVPCPIPEYFCYKKKYNEDEDKWCALCGFRLTNQYFFEKVRLNIKKLFMSYNYYIKEEKITYPTRSGLKFGFDL